MYPNIPRLLVNLEKVGMRRHRDKNNLLGLISGSGDDESSNDDDDEEGYPTVEKFIEMYAEEAWDERAGEHSGNPATPTCV